MLGMLLSDQILKSESCSLSAVYVVELAIL
uniref:Uncharacterized protein n=1 Tax=Arundo donax TaxID=35708 RepID=A0A0A9GKU8_ARUDO